MKDGLPLIQSSNKLIALAKLGVNSVWEGEVVKVGSCEGRESSAGTTLSNLCDD